MVQPLTDNQKAVKVIESLHGVYLDLIASAPLEEIDAGAADAYKTTSGIIVAAMDEGANGLVAAKLAYDFAGKEYLRLKKNSHSTYNHMLKTGYYGAREFLDEVINYWNDEN